DRDLETLVAAFERAQRGACELLLVTGSSGIGKSALVHPIQRLIVGRGRFVSGKFDQLGRTVPYAAITQACQELIKGILGETTARIEEWKEKLDEALGVTAQLMVDLVPELSLIVGPQQPVPELGPAEAQHRFELVFQRFLQTFTSAEHALV